MGLLSWLFGKNSLIGKALSSPAVKAQVLRGLADYVAQVPQLSSTNKKVIIGFIPELVDEIERLAAK